MGKCNNCILNDKENQPCQWAENNKCTKTNCGNNMDGKCNVGKSATEKDNCKEFYTIE